MSNESQTSEKPSVVPKQYLLPFILTTCCFSLWGFANDFTNPLVKVFEQVFIITTGQASWLQFAFYTGYFCMALPAAFFIRKFSYKSAILIGFLFYAIGALLAIPASLYAIFPLFLLGSYVLTFGLAFLETACNPYILAMGPRETATQRLNLAQAFNPIGSLVGMSVASLLLAPNLMVTELSDDLLAKNPEVVKYLVQSPDDLPTGATLKELNKEEIEKGMTEPYAFVLDDEFKTEVALYKAELPNFETTPGALGAASTNAMKMIRETNVEKFQEIQQADLGYVRTPYVVIAVVVLVFFCIFAVSRMPTFRDESKADAPFLEITGRIFTRPRFFGGVIAQLFNVGAQIMCWTFVVHYGMEYCNLRLGEAQSYNIAAMILFLSSRWVCTYLLRFFSPGAMLSIFAIGGVLFTVGAIYLPGKTGLISLVLVSGCLSLMFPTIYGIALDGMKEEEAKLGSAYLIMAIVGGAFLTKLQGGLIDDYGVRTSFWLPAGCFVIVAVYGLLTYSVFERKSVTA